MITIKATNMYDVAKEAQKKNRAKFDTHLESVIRDYASRGAPRYPSTMMMRCGRC